MYLTIDGEQIETTPEHPFYTSEGEWKPAATLQPGDKIRQADGSTGEVEFVRAVVKPQEMYNFTVAAAHTYFVGEGQWLVHNACFKFQQLAGQDYETKGFHMNMYEHGNKDEIFFDAVEESGTVWITPTGWRTGRLSNTQVKELSRFLNANQARALEGVNAVLSLVPAHNHRTPTTTLLQQAFSGAIPWKLTR